MPKIGDITVTETPGGGINHKDTPEQFLYENQDTIEEATKLFDDGRIKNIPENITDVLNETPGLRASAFNVGGEAPLNAVAVEFASLTESENAQFASLKGLIESDTNSHMYEEGGKNYLVIFNKYKELCERVVFAIDTYNSDRKYNTTSRVEGEGNDTVTIYTDYYYPECSFTCPIESAPELTWSETPPSSIPGHETSFVSQVKSPNYQAVKDAYDKAKAFYDHYAEDTISFKDSTEGLKEDGEEYDFETELTNLENNWPEGVKPTTPETEPDEEQQESEEEQQEPEEEKETPEGEKTEGEEETGKNYGDSDTEGESDQAAKASTKEPVTISCGQRVTKNGKDLYFLGESTRSGVQYFTRGTGEDEQVYVFDENGDLVPYISPVKDGIITRKDFIDYNKYNMSDYQWNLKYNGESDFDSVSDEIEPSFSAKLSDPSYTVVRNNADSVTASATTLTQFDRGAVAQGGNIPESIYLAPGQTIKYDKPWNPSDNSISGKSGTGTYLMYDADRDGYYVLDENYSYRTGQDIDGLFISKEDLLSDRTTISY